jgi:hypothetical protein
MAARPHRDRREDLVASGQVCLQSWRSGSWLEPRRTEALDRRGLLEPVVDLRLRGATPEQHALDVLAALAPARPPGQQLWRPRARGRPRSSRRRPRSRSPECPRSRAASARDQLGVVALAVAADRVGLTRSLARDACFHLARADKLHEDSIGITVNTVAPGFICDRDARARTRKLRERIMSQIPSAGSGGRTKSRVWCTSSRRILLVRHWRGVGRQRRPRDVVRVSCKGATGYVAATPRGPEGQVHPALGPADAGPQARSSTMAMPWPPPMQRLTSPSLWSSRSIS